MADFNSDTLVALDRQRLWHPYASIHNPAPIYPVQSAEGCELNLSDGRILVDGMASWWCAIHGYNHPVLNQAIQDQLTQMAHVMFGGLTHAPAVQLAETLVNIAPAGLSRVFLADSGSVSVEVALKMALQYWQAKGQPSKRHIMALRGGYHGDTLGAMSVCDPVTGMHHLFQTYLPQQHFLNKPRIAFDKPWDNAELNDLTDFFKQHHATTAALILEPIVQGAGGMWFYHPQYLKHLRDLCHEFNVLLIVDEIATGFGRTGKLFACEWADLSPDILCVGKALTGGYLSLAATLCQDFVAETICRDEHSALMHGPTFMGNPLACAVANASLKELLQSPWQPRIERIESQLNAELKVLKNHPNVQDVRILGAMGVIELREPLSLAWATPLIVEQGVWLRPFGRLLYTMPPYIVTPLQLTKITNAMVHVINALT